ncbi:MAG: hypothetical protein GY716_17310 [bacterium]|nr:hypothetical protein [bacterium]
MDQRSISVSNSRLVLAVALAIALSGAAHADGSSEKLTASDGGPDDWFGWAVSASGDVTVVGATNADDAGWGTGAAYVYQRNQGGAGNWGQVAKLLASDGAAFDNFGISVSVSGTVAVVGAWADDDAGNAAGAAYLFARDEGGSDNWGQVAKLASSDLAAGDEFGRSVSVSGDVALVGAWADDDLGDFSGSAYVFARNAGGPDNWGQIAKLTASDGVAGDRFGWSLSVSGDVAVVGAWSAEAAYVFHRDEGGPDNWGQVAKLTGSESAAGDRFGWSVSVSGDRAIVSSWLTNPGAAYIFARNESGSNNWGEVTRLTATGGFVGDEFGESVSISGDYAVVGAQLDDDAEYRAGAAYVFARNNGGPDNWGQVTKLTAFDAGFEDQFGSAVTIGGDVVAVGANFADAAEYDSGSAYAFHGDRDFDLVDDAVDCEPDNHSNSVLLGPARNLRFSTRSDFEWDLPSEDGGGVVFDVLRSHREDDFSLAQCIPPAGTSSTTATDTDLPASIFYYVVRVESVCGGDHLGLRTEAPVRRTGASCQ